MSHSQQELRQMILDEMNARRIPHKTYLDAEWALKQYERAVYQQALADVRAGVPGERNDTDESAMYGHNTCRTTVLEHLDLLGKE